MRYLAPAGLVVGFVGLAALTAACGSDDQPAPDTAPPAPVLDRLRALPNVHDVTETPTDTAGYTYYVLHFTQPVDHDAPGGATFLQEVSLLHKDTAAPLIAHTSGYWDYYLDRPVELTILLGGNQISIEHRFFGASRPDPADWSKLTIQQMAADEHEIVTALRTIYTGKTLTTGGSKGGMTAIYYRRFYPDDVDATVPYVAPISFGAPDARYTPFLDTVGPAACRQAVRDVAVELLSHRRAQMEQRAMNQAVSQNLSYTRIAMGPAVESSIISLEWAFWQYHGVSMCPDMPPTSASDQTLFSFLDQVSPVSDNADDSIAQFEAYYYQAYFQLGYPDASVPYLTSYLMYTDRDYDGALPTALPTYDTGTAMHDVDQFVQGQGSRLLFVYGQWDPWTGGEFELGGAQDSLRLIQPQGTHGSRITSLAPADRDAAFAKLEAWTGVTIGSPRLLTAPLPEPPPPRMPPALLRLHARRASP
jgi:hypothetical protein